MKKIFLILLLLIITSPAQAYVILTEEWKSGIGVRFWSTDNMPIDVIIDKPTTDNGEKIIGLVLDSLAVWQNVKTTYLSYNIKEYLDENINYDVLSDSQSSHYESIIPALNSSNFTTNNEDGKHEIVFDEDGKIFENIFGVDSTSVLGAAIPFSDATTGEILDGVVFINTSIGLEEGVLQAAIVHELGHFIGIAHSNIVDSYLTDDLLPTMYYTKFPNDDSLGKDLAIDDIGVLSSLYPANNINTELGCIEGKVQSSTGEGVFGASVVLLNIKTNEAMGGLSGYITGNAGKGEFGIYGVQPGTYVLYVYAINSSTSGRLNGAIIGGIFEDITKNFEEEFYNNIQQTFTDFYKNIPENAYRFEIGASTKISNVVVTEGTDINDEIPIQETNCQPQFPGNQNLDFAKLPNPAANFKTTSGGCQLVINSSHEVPFFIVLLIITAVLLAIRKKGIK